MDRGTEPKTSPTKRKSWVRSLALYDAAIRRELPARHYGLTALLLMLWVFTGTSAEDAFWRLLAARAPGLAERVLTAAVDGRPEALTQRLEAACRCNAQNRVVCLFAEGW